MKRDMELIRELMLTIELQNDDRDTNLQPAGHDESQINYHLELLIEAGLVVGEVHHMMGGNPPVIRIERLSWEGHEFLDNARNEPVWKDTMKQVKEKGGSVAVGILTQILASAAKQQFGLS
jgi:Hypothetical protein (DUF2513)